MNSRSRLMRSPSVRSQDSSIIERLVSFYNIYAIIGYYYHLVTVITLVSDQKR